jgi:hypothetical protein
VIPLTVVNDLGLVSHRSLPIGSLGGAVSQVDAYLIEIELRGFPPLTVEVVAANEPWILLGRDVDNHFRLLLDGPAGALEVA